MIRIAITAEAFDAVAATLPLGTVAYGAEIAASGERSIWVERSALDRLELVVRLGDDEALRDEEHQNRRQDGQGDEGQQRGARRSNTGPGRP